MLLEELGTASKAAEKVVFEPWLENVLTITTRYNILSCLFGPCRMVVLSWWKRQNVRSRGTF